MRLKKEDTLVVLVDLQERLVPVVTDAQGLVVRVSRLLQGLGLLGVPMLMTEQYPKGLGPTLPVIRALAPGVEPIPKLTFSACDEPHFLTALEAWRRPNVVLCGIEAHVCVLQTVLDLKEKGFQPVVVADAVSSRAPEDVPRALARMATEGAIITGVESLLFELARVAGTDTFKALSRLLK